jgi:hypothetical protein
MDCPHRRNAAFIGGEKPFHQCPAAVGLIPFTGRRREIHHLEDAMDGGTVLSERVAKVPPGTMRRLMALRSVYPRWRMGDGAYLGSPDRLGYFAVVHKDPDLERMHSVLSRA